jgi:hypothetical protein
MLFSCLDCCATANSANVKLPCPSAAVPWPRPNTVARGVGHPLIPLHNHVLAYAAHCACFLAFSDFTVNFAVNSLFVLSSIFALLDTKLLSSHSLDYNLSSRT